MPIDIYYMRVSPPCRAVMLAAKQLNIELNIKPIDLSKGEQLHTDFLKINPAHTLPTIDDNGFILWESRAIMQYLCNKYAPESSLYPSDVKMRAQVDRWLNFDLLTYATGRAALLPKLLYGIEPNAEKLKPLIDNLKLMDQLIGDKKYLATDELTIADLSVLVTVSYLALSTNKGLSDYPNVYAWFTHVKSELPFYDEVMGITKEEMEDFFTKLRLLFESRRK